MTSGQVSSVKRDAGGTPVIQGVNFLVPANIVRTAGRPALDSPRHWFLRAQRAKTRYYFLPTVPR